MMSSSLAFPIEGHQVHLVRQWKQRVQLLFHVVIDFGDVFKNQDGTKQWITLEGEKTASEEDIKKAKSYIDALCLPENTVCIENLMLTKGIRDSLERESAAHLQEQNGNVTIKGSEINVVIAQSLLEPRMAELRGGKKFQNKIGVKGKRLTGTAGPTQKNEKLTTSCSKSSLVYKPPATVQSTQQTSQASSLLKQTHTPASSKPPTHDINRQGPFHAKAKKVFQSPDYHQQDTTRTKNCSPKKTRPDTQQLETIMSASFTDCKGKRCIAQLAFLKNMGLASGYTEFEIEETLFQFDMNNIVQPSIFREALGQLREINQSLENEAVCRPFSSAKVTEMFSVRAEDDSQPQLDHHFSFCASHRQCLDLNLAKVSGRNDSSACIDSQLAEENIVISSGEDGSDFGWSETRKHSPDGIDKLDLAVNLEKSSEIQVNVTPSATHLASSTHLPSASSSQVRTTPWQQQTAIASHPTTSANGRHLRFIVVDGSNVAMSHGNHKVFSVRGIEICLNYFMGRGHQVMAFVPQSRLYSSNPQPIADKHLLDKLSNAGILKFTPARILDGRHYTSYDDLYILNLAEMEQGIVVSNDQFRDALMKQPRYKDIIQSRWLPYVFVGDHFMPPDDPLGRDGPRLDEFLAMSCLHQPVSHRLHSVRTDLSQASIVLPNASKTSQRQQPNTQPNLDTSTPSANFTATNTQCHQGQTSQKTTALFQQLAAIFPKADQKEMVRQVLANHKGEMDISRLTNYCLNEMAAL